MTDHIELGKKGEAIATEHLVFLGFTILESNWRHKKMEVDIIALKDNVLIMVEVKTRGTRQFGDPESFVDKKKQLMLADAAEEYILQNKLDVPVRYDIISVIIDEFHTIVMHIEDAFFPDNLKTHEAYY
jgi:putative endonuclease